ncbi:MAG: response regulator [Holosporaceae bacterium]|jgi:two-component system cell cycle response regulator DivK
MTAFSNHISAESAVANTHLHKKVLIVEDNELNMKLFSDLLEAKGFDVAKAKDGYQALELLAENRPDLILMDWQLPEITGQELTQRLKADPNTRAIPIIAVTAFAMKGDEEKIRNVGCEGYIAKPISVMTFLETVQSFLESTNS